MRERLFTDDELAYVAPKADPVPSLAARFAAREAVMKALGLGLGAFGFHDVWVDRRESGEPHLNVTGRAAELAHERGIATGTCRSPTPTRSPSPTSSPRDVASSACCRSSRRRRWPRSTLPRRSRVEVLIERAGAAVAWAALRMLGGAYGRTVT